MSNTHYYLSSCAPYSETAAANPMRAYSKEDCAEIIAHEGGTAYVLAEDHERELAVATRERDEARALNAQWAEKAAAWFASPEAAQRLQGYRDLAQQVATAQNERDEARAALLAIELAAASLADAQVIALEALAARADNEPNRLPSHRCSSLCSPDETFCAITKDGKCDAMDRSCDAALAATEPKP